MDITLVHPPVKYIFNLIIFWSAGYNNNLDIRVGCDESLTNSKLCTTYERVKDGQFGTRTSPTRTMYCTQEVYGCVVSIHQRYRGNSTVFRPLRLCEVEVFGEGDGDDTIIIHMVMLCDNTLDII